MKFVIWKKKKYMILNFKENHSITFAFTWKTVWIQFTYFVFVKTLDLDLFFVVGSLFDLSRPTHEIDIFGRLSTCITSIALFTASAYGTDSSQWKHNKRATTNAVATQRMYYKYDNMAQSEEKWRWRHSFRNELSDNGLISIAYVKAFNQLKHYAALDDGINTQTIGSV